MHASVLPDEVVERLALREGEVFVDCTINGGGHSERAVKLLGKSGVLVGIDLDEDALNAAKWRLRTLRAKKYFFQGNFRNLDQALKKFHINKADKILFDLGLSSRQLENSRRGFSFREDELLLMTFSADSSKTAFTASEIVNEWDEENIATILLSYGEERFAKRIARAIVDARGRKRIETSRELSEIVREAVPRGYRKGKIHPATKTFQAIRMTVNDELQALDEGLEKAWKFLAQNGRMAVISFHSLEERVVKNFFRKKEKDGEGKRITKKAITPTREEVLKNPRSRSAKLRVIEKTI